MVAVIFMDVRDQSELVPAILRWTKTRFAVEHLANLAVLLVEVPDVCGHHRLQQCSDGVGLDLKQDHVKMVGLYCDRQQPNPFSVIFVWPPPPVELRFGSEIALEERLEEGAILVAPEHRRAFALSIEAVVNRVGQMSLPGVPPWHPSIQRTHE
jgi:hypothetical protein